MPLKKFDVLAIGGATRDIIFYTDEGTVIKNKKNLTRERMVCFEQGAKINIKDAYFSTGGGACNTAISFSRLGLKASIIARVGDDKEGEKAREDLEHERVNLSLIQIDKKLSTGFSFIVVTGGQEQEHTAFLFRGANDTLEITDQELQKINARWIYVSSLTGVLWKVVLGKVVRYIQTSKYPPGGWRKKEGTNFVWNPGSVQLRDGKGGLEKFLRFTDVLILNKDEAIELVLSDKTIVKPNSQLKKVEYLLEIIYSWGVTMAVITDGEKGAYVYDGDKIYYEKARKVEVADTTGAGDAFGSSFIAGLYLYNNIEKALRLALINSASVVTEIGAQRGLLQRQEVEKLS